MKFTLDETCRYKSQLTFEPMVAISKLFRKRALQGDRI